MENLHDHSFHRLVLSPYYRLKQVFEMSFCFRVKLREIEASIDFKFVRQRKITTFFLDAPVKQASVFGFFQRHFLKTNMGGSHFNAITGAR